MQESCEDYRGCHCMTMCEHTWGYDHQRRCGNMYAEHLILVVVFLSISGINKWGLTPSLRVLVGIGR